jgi:hypothetical protein
MEAGKKRQHYLGPDSLALRRWMEEVREERSADAEDRTRRAELVAMLAAGGARRESAAMAQVLQALADAGVFRTGAALVGTQAFNCYSNMLGVRLVGSASRTQDIDVAQDPTLSLALDPERVPEDVGAALERAEPKFFAVPALDRKRPSTSFKVRGRDLRVDFLTPRRRGEESGPVFLPFFQVAALPVPFLGYLLDGMEQAVVLGGDGILVNVPQPARFALHKLWLSRQRPAAEQAKARKDLHQAVALLGVLASDRPGDLTLAWSELGKFPEAGRVRAALGQLAADLRAEIEGLLGDG